MHTKFFTPPQICPKYFHPPTFLIPPNCTESTVKGAILLNGWPVKNHRFDVIPVLKIENMVLKIGGNFHKNGKKSLVPWKNRKNNPWSRKKFGKMWKNNHWSRIANTIENNPCPRIGVLENNLWPG